MRGGTGVREELLRRYANGRGVAGRGDLGRLVFGAVRGRRNAAGAPLLVAHARRLDAELD